MNRIRTLALLGRCAFLAAGCGSQPLPEAGDGRVVEQALRADGRPAAAATAPAGSVYDYIKAQHQFVPTSHVRPGDVVFFRIDGRCPDHAGWVEEVEDSGRIAFRESRYGIRPAQLPVSRRARRAPRPRRAHPEQLLRARRPDDPPTARYYAGRASVRGGTGAPPAAVRSNGQWTILKRGKA